MTTKSKKAMPVMEQAKSYHLAYEFMNKTLFDGKLSRPMLLFTRNPKVIGGYFAPLRWKDENGNKIHEISINANVSSSENAVEVLQILVHEMCHLWQHELGKEPSKTPGYHNTEWAKKAVEVGLEPMGEGGKATGTKVSSQLIPQGPAEEAIALMPDDYMFQWFASADQDADPPEGGGGDAPAPVAKNPKKGKRQKYTCPLCGTACWAKHGHSFVCGPCGCVMVEQVTNE